MSLDAAKREIRGAGYQGTFSEPDRQYSDMIAKGSVISTLPAAGTALDRSKGKIKIVISNGAEPVITELYSARKAPDVGTPTTFVRVELEKPIGSYPTVIFEGMLNKGDEIPQQQFTRKASEHAKVSLLAGQDETSLTEQEEVLFPPGAGTTMAPVNAPVLSGTSPPTPTRATPGGEAPATGTTHNTPGTMKSPNLPAPSPKNGGTGE